MSFYISRADDHTTCMGDFGIPTVSLAHDSQLNVSDESGDESILFCALLLAEIFL